MRFRTFLMNSTKIENEIDQHLLNQFAALTEIFRLRLFQSISEHVTGESYEKIGRACFSGLLEERFVAIRACLASASLENLYLLKKYIGASFEIQSRQMNEIIKAEDTAETAGDVAETVRAETAGDVAETVRAETADVRADVRAVDVPVIKIDIVLDKVDAVTQADVSESIKEPKKRKIKKQDNRVLVSD